jgi:hypothetical protein
MDAKYTDDFFRAVYNDELDHKSKQDSADSLLFGVLVVLCGVGTYYARILPVKDVDVAGYWFIALSIVFGIAVVIAIIAAIGSIWPRDRGFISSPDTWATNARPGHRNLKGH